MSDPYTVFTPEEIAKRIAVPLKEWAGNCRPICEKFIAAGLMDDHQQAEIVDGVWIGAVEPHTMYCGRNEPISHSWIEFKHEGDTYVLDPTRYVFEGEDYYIYCGHKTLNEYCASDDEIALLGVYLKQCLTMYKTFRKTHGLKDCPPNPLEIVNGLTDKVGRIARLVKHNYRDDPKPDWEASMQQQLAGVFNYLLMCEAYHGLDFTEGFKAELTHAIGEWSGKS